MGHRRRTFTTVTAAALSAALSAPLAACAPTTVASPATSLAANGTGQGTAAAPAPATAAETAEKDPQWAKMLDAKKSVLALLEVTDCIGSGTGTGFFVDEDLVLTAAHVVADSADIIVRTGNRTTRAKVLGYDPLEDVALLKTDLPVADQHFEILSTDPQVDSPIASLGFTKSALEGENTTADDRFKFSAGAIRGFLQRVPTEAALSEGLMKTDHKIIAGDSGSPIINAAGEVVGMGIAAMDSTGLFSIFDDNESYAVPSRVLREAVQAWRDNSVSETSQCEPGSAFVDFVTVGEVESQHEEAADILNVLQFHGSAINMGAFEDAYALYSKSSEEGSAGIDAWATEAEKSYWVYLDVKNVRDGGDSATATVERWTVQDPADATENSNQWCSIFENEYTFTREAGAWVIKDVSDDTTPTACDEEDLVDSLGDEAMKVLDAFGG